MVQSNTKPTLEESLAFLLSQNERTIAMLDGIATKADENFIKIEGRLSKIEDRLSKTEDRLSKNEARLNSLSAETSTNFIKVAEQLSGIKAEIAKISAATRYEQFHEDQKKFD